MNTHSLHSNSRFLMIDALRGIACLAVVLFHASEGGHIDTLVNTLPYWIAGIFKYGDTGVSVFFVISGFVIANSMMRDDVTGNYIVRFIVRRSFRLDPPYWMAMVLAVCSGYISMKLVPAKQFEFPSGVNLLLHVTYLIDIARQPLINPVFWTLCIEIQFYVSFVLIVWLVTRLSSIIERKYAIDILLTFCASIALLWQTPFAPFHIHGFFIEHWHLFIAGVLVWRAVYIPKSLATFFAVLYLGILMILVTDYSGKLHGLVGPAIALMMIAGGWHGFLKSYSGGRVMQWLGLISYSLYLTHNTITGAGFRIGYMISGRSLATEFFWLICITVGCCLFAWIFYIMFEKTGLKWSKKITLHRHAGGSRAIAS